jgi:ubiquitin-activating enzyme E1 C
MRRTLIMCRQLKKPSIRTGEKSLYMQMAGLEEQTRPNLEKKLSDLVEDGEEILITDRSFPTQFKYKLVYQK